MSKQKFIPIQGRLRALLEQKRILKIPVTGKKDANNKRNSFNYAVNHGMEKYKSRLNEDYTILKVWLIGGGE